MMNKNKNLRILAILLAQGILVYGHFMGHSPLTISLFIIFLAGFLVLSHLNRKLIKEEKKANAIAKISQRNEDRKGGKWVNFPKNGGAYINDNHPFSRDLNLFGQDSLFQFLNDTNTAYGEDLLKTLFLTEKRDKATILRRQEAIKELSQKGDFCQALKIEGITSKYIALSPEEMVNFFEGDKTLFKSPLTALGFRMLPVFSFSLILLNFILGYNNLLMTLTGFIIIVQVMIFVSISNKTEALLKELSKFKDSLDDFGAMATLIKKASFKADLNEKWQNKLPNKWPLKKITWALNIRNITLLDLFLNILFLWDIHCVCILEGMRKDGTKNIRSWLQAIGYFEAMGSMAVLPSLFPHWAYLDVTESFAIKATDLGHPLIEEPNRVTNHFTLDGIAIISGSNMAGKTTFLRTVGMNLALGYMGAPVCAGKFSAPVADIWTCMKPPDNLKQNISTFYAELMRIKNIIDNEKPMVFLIDEIFAGTNSEDRVKGAKQVLLNLNKPFNLGLITTHDLEVCKTEIFANYHFSEHYIDKKISFDFKIKEGVSTTRNAEYLMRMIGIDMK